MTVARLVTFWPNKRAGGLFCKRCPFRLKTSLVGIATAVNVHVLLGNLNQKIINRRLL